jgi:hypothetical protein
VVRGRLGSLIGWMSTRASVEAAEAPRFLSGHQTRPACEEGSIGLSALKNDDRSFMLHATVKRYEGVDQNKTDDLKRKINETLIPRMSRLSGFGGYYVIESENGVFTSVGLFGTSAAAGESSRIAADWVREEKLEMTLPNPPKITTGEVFAQKTNGIAA